MNLRIGHGYDLHRLQPTGVLLLGGIQVSDQISPIAHSDGDVLLHALTDALLGALAQGDIGDRFPNSDPQWKNSPSATFVQQVWTPAHTAGWRIENVDLTLLAERPKLQPFKQSIAQNIASLLHCHPSQINVKAGTNEGCDSIGRGESIAAHALVLLTKP